MDFRLWDRADEIMVQAYVESQVKDTQKWERATNGFLAQHTTARLIEDHVSTLTGKVWSESVYKMWHPTLRFDVYDFLRIDVKTSPAWDTSLDAACARLQLSTSTKHVDDLESHPDDLVILQTVHSLRHRKTVALCWATMKEIRRHGQKNPSIPDQWLLDKRDAHSFIDLVGLLGAGGARD